MRQNETFFTLFEKALLGQSARTARVCRQVMLASVLLSLRERNFPLAEREEYADRARRPERIFLAAYP